MVVTAVVTHRRRCAQRVFGHPLGRGGPWESGLRKCPGRRHQGPQHNAEWTPGHSNDARVKLDNAMGGATEGRPRVGTPGGGQDVQRCGLSYVRCWHGARGAAYRAVQGGLWGPSRMRGVALGAGQPGWPTRGPLGCVRGVQGAGGPGVHWHLSVGAGAHRHGLGRVQGKWHSTGHIGCGPGAAGTR